MRRSLKLNYAMLLVVSWQSGCASLPSGHPDPKDRFERFNRSVYSFNHTLDRAILRPVARGYVKVTPLAARTCIANFFSNLAYPVTIVNDTLQGKLRDGLSDIGRFGTNTVVGIGGCFDPASRWGMPKHDEDFGQTLGAWGVPSGPFLLLPILGPSSVRDAPAKAVDHFTTPAAYLRNTNVALALYGAGVVNTRAALLDSDALIDSAYDPYAFLRDAWLQRREYQVKDGNVPMDAFPSEPLPSDGVEASPMK